MSELCINDELFDMNEKYTNEFFGKLDSRNSKISYYYYYYYYYYC